MATVSLLDHYRLLLSRDPVAFRVLSHCFAQGPSTEAEIQSDDLGLPDVKSRLLLLFRANFLQQTPESRWATTELANALLARMGLAGKATEWLIESTDLDRDEREFLKASVRLADADDFWVGLNRHSRCLVVLDALDEFQEPDATGQSKNDALFSALVGLNPRAEALGPQGFVDVVARYLSPVAFADRERITKKVERSLEDANASNRCLLFGAPGTGKSALTLTKVRLLAAARSGQLDEGMQCLASGLSKQIDELWSSLKTRYDGLSKQLMRLFFVTRGRKEQTLNDQLLGQIKKVLQSYLEHSPCVDRVWTRNFDYLLERELVDDPAQKAKELVATLGKAIESYQFELLSPQAKESLCGSLEEYARLYRQRLIATRKTPVKKEDTKLKKAVKRSRRKCDS